MQEQETLKKCNATILKNQNSVTIIVFETSKNNELNFMKFILLSNIAKLTFCPTRHQSELLRATKIKRFGRNNITI